MTKKFFGMLVTTFLIVTETHSYNEKLLDSEADTYTSKICSGVTIRKEKVQESLDFLNKGDAVDPKYSQSTFHNQVVAQVQGAQFAKFAGICRGVYDEGDETTKIAVNLLLERVAGKYKDFLKKTQQLKAPAAQAQDSPPAVGTGQLINIFSTADKSIKLPPAAH